MSILRNEDVEEAWRQLSANNWQAARTLSERVLAAEPERADAWHTLSLAYWGLSNLPAALEALDQATKYSKGDSYLWSDLGVLLYGAKLWDRAARAFHESLRLDGQNLTALRGLADSLLQDNRLAEARQAFQQYLSILPDDPQVLRSLATCLVLERRLEEALATVERSLVLEPHSERGLTTMVTILQNLKRYECSLQVCEMLAQRQPASFSAQARLAVAYWEVGDIDRALTAREHALRLPQDDLGLHASLSWVALHNPNQTAAGLLQAHRATSDVWAGAPTVNKEHSNDRDPGRRLRVGYLSGEFMSNPVSCFFLPWLPRHDKNQVETYYYMSRKAHDAHTDIYRRFADHWLDVWEMSDDELATRILGDSIDILVDLSGHFGENRLAVFARRPAPVQITYPNYPSTTGMRNVDYIFTDVWTTPRGCDGEYSEAPCRLPSGYLVFQLPIEAATQIDPPMLSNGYATFGLFQRPSKYNSGFWDAVAGVLSQTPGSRLLVHFASDELDQPSSKQRARITEPLEDRGIAAARVMFRGTQPTANHLATVGSVDIAFDTFPYNGQTTTCDCLWMGVPVVTLEGSTHVGRVTAGLLRRAGLDILIARSIPEYVAIAVNLARHPQKVSKLRSGMRAAIATGHLNDGETLVREVEQVYRTLWSGWCAQNRPSS